MPITEPVWVISETPDRAIPKSVTLALPSESTITFWGFRSRWMTLWRWANFAASSTWIDQRRGLLRRQAGVDQLLQRAALDELHRDEVGAVDLTPVEDRDDVGVLKRGGGLGLAPEAFDELPVLGEALVEDLQRDPTLKVGVLGEPDVGHPPGADPVEEPVAPGDHRAFGDLSHWSARCSRRRP